jgi:hypothetical protein
MVNIITLIVDHDMIYVSLFFSTLEININNPILHFIRESSFFGYKSNLYKIFS